MPMRLLHLLAALPLLIGPAPAHQAVWPLQPQPQVMRGFDPPDSTYGAGHRGVDLAGQVGQTVHVAMTGTVVFAGLLAGRGVVVVDHGTVRTTYEPVAATVGTGDRVTQGAAIGRLTLSQSHCFPQACLHWGLIRNSDDVYLDPLTLVDQAPIRLLPLWRDLPWAFPFGAIAFQARGCACW
jgi:murein DD-endopeptidase MepM/ murein hydrolase activator NlpD